MVDRVGNNQKIRERRWKFPRGVLLLMLVFGVLFFYLWEQVEIMKLGYRIDELNKKREKLLEEKRRLSLEKAFLSSPERIERIAKTKLGMRYPKPEEVIIIGEENRKR